MQENEFEKQVRSTMDEFRLRPSEPVWRNIREEIRDKKRRRMLILIPVFAGLLAAGFFVAREFSSTQTVALSGTDSPKTGNELDKMARSTPAPSTTAQPITPGKDSGGSSPAASIDAGTQKLAGTGQNLSNYPLENSKAALISNKTMGFLKKNQNPVKQLTGNRQLNAKTAKIENHISANKNYELNEKSAVSSQNLLPVKNKKSAPNDRAFSGKGNDVLVTANVPEFQFLPDLISAATIFTGPKSSAVDSINASDLVILMPAQKPGKLFKAGKLKWGLEVSAGLSSRVERPFKLVTAEQSTPATGSFTGIPVNVGTAGNSISNGGLLVSPPSAVKAGAAFKMGINLSKSLSPRFDISAGLRYSFFSDRITIGETLYSATNLTLQDRNYTTGLVSQASYSGLKPQHFTNKYHFIELPLAVDINLTRKWKSPFSWNIGVAIGQLVATNSLLYDETWGGLYYPGKNDLNKTQVSLSTGLAIRLNRSSQWQWKIGPEITMNSTELYKVSSDNKKHLVYGGIHLQLLMPGKKR